MAPVNSVAPECWVLRDSVQYGKPLLRLFLLPDSVTSSLLYLTACHHTLSLFTLSLLSLFPTRLFPRCLYLTPLPIISCPLIKLFYHFWSTAIQTKPSVSFSVLICNFHLLSHLLSPLCHLDSTPSNSTCTSQTQASYPVSEQWWSIVDCWQGPMMERWRTLTEGHVIIKSDCGSPAASSHMTGVCA